MVHKNFDLVQNSIYTALNSARVQKFSHQTFVSITNSIDDITHYLSMKILFTHLHADSKVNLELNLTRKLLSDLPQLDTSCGEYAGILCYQIPLHQNKVHLMEKGGNKQ
jgi:fructose-1,6-bisphosphatase